MTSRTEIQSRILLLNRDRIRILLHAALKRHQLAVNKTCTKQLKQIFSASIDAFANPPEDQDTVLDELFDRLKQTDEYQDPDPLGFPNRLTHQFCVLCAYCLNVFRGRYLKKEVPYFIEPMVQIGAILDSQSSAGTATKTVTLRRPGQERPKGDIHLEQLSFLAEYVDRLLDDEAQLDASMKRIPSLRM